MFFLRVFKSSGHRGLRDPPYTLREIACRPPQPVGVEAFGSSLPSCLFISLANCIPGSLKPLACGGLPTTFDRVARLANQIVLKFRARKHTGDQSPDGRTDACNQKGVLFDLLEQRFAGAITQIRRRFADRAHRLNSRIPCGGRSSLADRHRTRRGISDAVSCRSRHLRASVSGGGSAAPDWSARRFGGGLRLGCPRGERRLRVAGGTACL